MTAKKIKPDKITPAIAAAQARQVAEFFIDSMERAPTGKLDQARKLFLASARLSLPRLSLPGAQMACTILAALWGEQLSKSAVVPEAGTIPAGAKDALASVRASLAATMAEIDRAMGASGSMEASAWPF